MSASNTIKPDSPFNETILKEFPPLMEELARLMESNLPVEEFQGEFLERVVRITRATGGAFWEKTPEGKFQLQCQINLAALKLNSASPEWEHHTDILLTAARRERPLWVPPLSETHRANGTTGLVNPAPFGLMVAPVVVDKQVLGLVEIWLENNLDLTGKRSLARLLQELTGFAAAFQHKHQWQTLLNQQKLWARLESFARQIHASLDPTEVAQLVAYEIRQQLECDQVSVGLKTGKTVHVAAVSGAHQVEKRSCQVQTMRRLFEAVMAWGEPLVYKGTRDESLPPNVVKALDHYLAESNSKLLIVYPLHDLREQEGKGTCTSVLLAETFEPNYSAEQFQSRLTVVAEHAAIALYNAVQFRRLPLRWLTRPLAGIKEGLDRRGYFKLGLAGAILLVVVGFLGFYSVPYRLEAKGQLLPRQRQMVFAPLPGKIVDVKTQHGEWVEKGQELLLIEDLETQLQIDQLGLKISAAEKKLALLNEQLGKTQSQEDRQNLSRERIHQDYEMRKAMVERDILLQASRSPRKSPVAAPLTGKVVTFDAQEQLLGKTVKPGDPLLRIARSKGPWEMELHIPEDNIAAIREGLFRSSDGFLEVHFMLASHPQKRFKGRLYRTDLGGETMVKDNQVVLPARVQITDGELESQLDQLPVGIEIRAKVVAGHRALGFVWFHDLWEFFYERFVF